MLTSYHPNVSLSLPSTNLQQASGFFSLHGSREWFQTTEWKKTSFTFHETLVGFYRNPDFKVLKNNPSKTGQFLANPPCLPKPTTSHILVVSNTWLGSIPQDAIVTKITLHVYARESLHLPRLASWVGLTFKSSTDGHFTDFYLEQKVTKNAQDGFKGLKKDMGAVWLADMLLRGNQSASGWWVSCHPSPEKIWAKFCHIFSTYRVKIEKNRCETT